jgi:hypothetical protein
METLAQIGQVSEGDLILPYDLTSKIVTLSRIKLLAAPANGNRIAPQIAIEHDAKQVRATKRCRGRTTVARGGGFKLQTPNVVVAEDLVRIGGLRHVAVPRRNRSHEIAGPHGTENRPELVEEPK